MLHRNLLGALVVTVLAIASAPTRAFDDAKYPNLKGQWNRVIVPGLPGQPSFDQTKSGVSARTRR